MMLVCFFRAECGSFCTCVCRFSTTASTTTIIILLRRFRFALPAHSNYFILIFQFRNDNNNLPAAKPKIKFTAIQNANNGIFAMALFRYPRVSFARTLCPLLCHRFLDSPHTHASHTSMCDYLHFCSIIYLRVKIFLTPPSLRLVACICTLFSACAHFDIQQNLLPNNFQLCRHFMQALASRINI